ncbi:alpha-galactosidase [Allokutzneria sp. A3M-2-11 16]|uniref:glycoside hydrolase family 36 protein n=1 Tax=Allokutzneria sp. A3M-2-11 16 TaxID=2962043 RepID=UPI0020B7C87D|nr:glycoside hydrolase family 36 protein [Allokutzneria sp. A3M-2-11 16]MCP3800269.1 alpha-galactosidase [Allokutzneria sp. A3M-2-11 16]
METIAEIQTSDDTVVHEQGWQSWSPSTSYRLGAAPHRPVDEDKRLIAYRHATDPAPGTYCGEGLFAVAEGDSVTLFAAADPTAEVPTILAVRDGDRLVISANGSVEIRQHTGDIPSALTAWADEVCARLAVPPPRPAPTGWCSWYEYFTDVTADDIVDNLEAMEDLELPIDVVQVDDGYQREVGDWLVPSGRFPDVPGLFAHIRDHGRRAGIWTAPFLVSARSELLAEHPDWLVGKENPVLVGHNWGQALYALDTTHPAARDYLRTVFTTFAEWGIDYHKIDFVYAGAVPGRRHADVSGIEAYRDGLELIREVIGPDAYLLGCGAPQLPSIGVVDAMRVSPDIALEYAPDSGDLSQPAQLGAVLNGESRRFQHGRFWVNDPDCIVARPAVEHRTEWAEHISVNGGLRASSDRLRGLDSWGLDTTRRLLSEPIPARFT